MDPLRKTTSLLYDLTISSYFISFLYFSYLHNSSYIIAFGILYKLHLYIDISTFIYICLIFCFICIFYFSVIYLFISLIFNFCFIFIFVFTFIKLCKSKILGKSQDKCYPDPSKPKDKRSPSQRTKIRPSQILPCGARHRPCGARHSVCKRSGQNPFLHHFHTLQPSKPIFSPWKNILEPTKSSYFSNHHTVQIIFPISIFIFIRRIS